MKSAATSQLINQLEAIAGNTMLPLERRLIDMTIWYHRNLPTISEANVLRRLEFAEKSMDIMIEMIALIAQRLQAAEGRKSEKLWLPNATQPITLHGR